MCLLDASELVVWLLGVLKSKEPKFVQVIDFGLWIIWNARNALVFNQKFLCLQGMAQETYEASFEFNVSRQAGQNRAKENVLSLIPKGLWSVQLNAGCFDNGVVSLLCVIKEPTGNIALAACKKMSSHANPITAKLLGIQ